MGRASNTDERRAEIAAALIDVMAAEGYDGASVQRIAKAAKMAPGLVHYHFKDKREILLASIDTLHEGVRARVSTAIATGDTPKAKVDAFISALLARDERSDPKWVAAWIAIGAEAVRTKKVADAYRAVIDSLIDSIEPVIASALSGRRKRESRAIAAALVAAVQGYFTLAMASPHAVPKGSAERCVRQMASGLMEGAQS